MGIEEREGGEGVLRLLITVVVIVVLVIIILRFI